MAAVPRWLRPTLDALLALGLFGLSVLPLTADPPDCDCVVTPWAFVAAAGQTLPLAWRRRYPLAVNLVIAPSAIVFGFGGWPSPLLPVGPLVALHAIAAYGRCWPAIAALAVAVVAAPLTIAARPSGSDPYEGLNLLLAVGVAWLAGAWTRSRRTARLAEEDRAVAEERNRIAREMHDLLGHSMGVMVVLAEGGAEALARDRPEAGARALDLIAKTGREAMGDLRRTLDPGAAELHPAPTTADLPALVAPLQAAGVDVTLTMDGPPIEGPAGLVAYRIAQEAVTNALKHAPGRPVTVTAGPDGVVIANPVGGGAVGAPGRGLRGMRERAASIGADLAIGAGDGRFTVTLRVRRAANDG